MCGICGIVDFGRNSQVREESLRLMCSALKHRGPDDEGVFLNKATPSVGLGHRRLSIIDLSSSGHQPLSNEDKTVWITFNGEIYNYKELRVTLEDRGHMFKSLTDTETIVHLYEEHGENCVKYLRGMFAFAIWDSRDNSLLLARDRIGKKPLLYYREGNKFCFASEFLSLLSSGLIDKEINFNSIDYYLSFGYIPAPLTIYKKVFKLLPGHILILKDNNLITKKYWELDYSNKLKISEEDAAEEILRLLNESVKIRLYSDVPLGAFLSGGIDSSTIVALMSKISKKKVQTFSIGFEEKDYSELDYARKVAKAYCTDHHEFIVRPDALKILPLLVEHYGEPYSDSSAIPTYYVSWQTRQYVTVALNGDGGDELFGGYERYQGMLLADKIPHTISKIASSLLGLFPDLSGSKSKLRRIKKFFEGAVLPFPDRYSHWMSIFDATAKKNIYSDDFLKNVPLIDFVNFMKPFFHNSGEITNIDSLLLADTMVYLPNDLLVKVDIASMANSLEARSPFLDHKLIEFVAKLPSDYKIRNFVKKFILKKAVKNIIPLENIHRKKMGFGAPIGEWFRNELKDLVEETLLSRVSLNRGYFKQDAIKNIVKQHIERKLDYSFRIWALLMLELWHQRFIDHH